MHEHIIIGLGAGLERQPSGEPPYRWIGKETALRAAAAAKLWQANPSSIIVFSGGRMAGEDAPAEADVMQDYVLRSPWNVPAANVLMEEESIDTAENVRNVAALLKERNLARGGRTLIAGRKNLYRAAAYFSAHGLPVNARLARDVLGSDLARLGLPDVSDDVSPGDRMHEILLCGAQLVDRTGRLATWYVRRQRRL